MSAKPKQWPKESRQDPEQAAHPSKHIVQSIISTSTRAQTVQGGMQQVQEPQQKYKTSNRGKADWGDTGNDITNNATHPAAQLCLLVTSGTRGRWIASIALQHARNEREVHVENSPSRRKIAIAQSPNKLRGQQLGQGPNMIST